MARALFAAALTSVVTGCGGGDDDAPDDGGVADDGADGGDDGGDGGGGGPVLTRPSRSSTIALSDNGAWVAMVNPESGTLSVFQTSDNSRIGEVQTGGEPSSVVIAPDNTTAFVANRADATVVRVRGIDTATPTVDASIGTGSEPVAVALSPTGRILYVAEMAESRVNGIDATSMTGLANVQVDRPRALLVTNNGDGSDADETLIVTEFYGEPTAGGEARDDGRIGHVRRFAVSDLADRGDITLSPLDSGFARGGDPGNGTVLTSPNQLASLAVAGNRLFITSVSASPEGPPRFDNNVFPVVHVADLGSGAEVTDDTGTTNLARKIVDAIPNPTPESPRFIPGELSDIDFVPGKAVSYAVGRAGDVMLRVVFDGPVAVGSSQNVEIDLAGNDDIGRCQGPTGIAVVDETRVYVNCWVTRRLGVVDLGTQSLTSTVESAPAPQSQAEQSVARGRRFYFTGRGRWSNDGRNDAAGIAGNGALGGEGWSSCASCHPDGLSDNVTWVFAAGPRQTTSQDGSFSHGSVQQKQRIFNWTGIFDEHHDFERNTRDVSGGLGAITTAATPEDCNNLALETPVALTVAAPNPEDPPVAIGGLAQSLKELADDAAVATCGHEDWDDVDAFVRTIRPPKARQAIRDEVVEQGRALFIQGGCAGCHGGAGWTVSRRFYQPSDTTNGLLASTDFLAPDFFTDTLSYGPRTQISAQPPIPADPTGAADPVEEGENRIGEVACVLRNVGTFGDLDEAALTAQIERRAFNGQVFRAEGRGGYNVPALYGVALGAPFLHHGQAASLETLFTDRSWRFHTNAGNANFEVTLGEGDNLQALVSFLWSIDAEQPEIEPRDGSGNNTDLACPVQFP